MKKNSKNKVNFYLKIIVCILIFSGCKSRSDDGFSESKPGDSTKYAKGFSISEEEAYTKVVINNPWGKDDSKPYAVYYLCNDESVKLPDDGIKMKTPLTSVTVNTFSYFEFLNLIDELDKVTGVSDAERIYNPEILDKLKENRITDLGDPFNPNFEKSLMLRGDAVITSAYAQQDTYNERVIKTGIPIIYSLEWMEESPLARAEWIKLIAAFFNKSEIADSIFNEIEERYVFNKKIAESIQNKPTILAGDNFQGTWYMPGGGSFNAALFADAGIDYHYKDDNRRGSIGLDIESVLTRFGSVDFWFGSEADSYDELERKDKKYMLLNPVKKKRVFSNRNRTTPSGGNDYFESAVANPDLLLKDLMKAAHPELFSSEEFTYLKSLN